MLIPLFHPESPVKILWEVYLLFLTIAVTILAPLMIVFNLEMTPSRQIFEIVVTSSFAIDIIVQFNTGFLVRQELVKSRKAIILRYLKGWFLLDLIATIPFYLVFSMNRYVSLNRIFRFFRLARLFKLFGSSKTLNRARKIGFVNPALMRLFLLVFWILVAAHLIACGWIFIGGVGEDASNGETYLKSFYWTVTTLTTIGYGDIVPTNPVQRIFVIIIMLMGAAIYGFIIGNIANIIANIDVAKSQFREKVENVDTFFKYRNLPIGVQKRVHDYYEYLWESRRGYDESKLLSDLPTSLKTQVAFFLNKDIIEKVPIFKNATPEFIRDVIMNLTPAIYMPEDPIVTYGEIGYETYFISRGEVEVTNKEGTIVFNTLSSGQFFGEMALLLSTPRTATVRAKVYCDLYVLERDTFESILQRYPAFAKDIEAMAEIRRKELISLNAPHAVEAAPSVPMPPGAPDYRILDDKKVRISWPPASGADYYEIVRKDRGERLWKRLSAKLRSSVYLDSPQGECVYRVRGVNKIGKGEWSPPLHVR